MSNIAARPTLSDLAVSYTRFSHSGQADGDSERRQWAAFVDFCQRHTLRPAKQSFIDRGLSGYSGKHRRKGDLGRLEELAKRHTFPRAAVLVVEAWDRLGRLRPDKQIELISGLLRAGLRIGVCRLNDIFTETDFGTPKFTVLSVFCQLAYEESQQKSERLTKSWQNRKECARTHGEPVTTALPGWLQMVNGEMIPIPERVAVVKRIFKLAGSGYGIKKILHVLAEERIPPFGKAHHWSSTYVRKLLTSRQVLGEFQPERFEEEQPDGTRKKVKDGPPIPNYYPAIITEDEFNLACQGAGERKGRSGPRQRKFINLFQGLLRNAWTAGDTMLLANKGTTRQPRLYLINDAGHNSGHKQVRFSYPIFERAILKLLREVPVSVVAPTAPTPLLHILQARHDAIVADIEALTADLRKGYSASITAVLREKELQLPEAKAQREQAQFEEAHPSSQTWKEAGDLMAAIEKSPDEEARLRLRAAFRRAIESITVLVLRRGIDSCCFVHVRFKSGISRIYIVWLRPPHRAGKTVRAGFWWAASAPFETLDVDLNSQHDQQFAQRFVANWQEPEITGEVVSQHFIRETIPA